MKIKELIKTIKSSDLDVADELIAVVSENYPFTETELDECSNIVDWGLHEILSGISVNRAMQLTHDIILKYQNSFNWTTLGYNLEQRIKYKKENHLQFTNEFIGKVLQHLSLEVLESWVVGDHWQTIIKQSEKNMNFNEVMFDIFNNTGFQMMLPFTKDYLLENRENFVDFELLQNPNIEWSDDLLEAFVPFKLDYKTHHITSFEQLKAIQDKRKEKDKYASNMWCVAYDEIAYDWYAKESRLEVIEFTNLLYYHEQKYILIAPDIKPAQIADCNHDWISKWPMPIQTIVTDIIKSEYNINI